MLTRALTYAIPLDTMEALLALGNSQPPAQDGDGESLPQTNAHSLATEMAASTSLERNHEDDDEDDAVEPDDCLISESQREVLESISGTLRVRVRAPV